MILHLIKKSFILLLLSVSLVHAKSNISNQDEIPCASVTIIQASAQKLDTAQKVNDTYIAYTATYVFQSNDLWWFIGVGNISANSANEAIKIGKDFLKNATVQIDKYATKVGRVCKFPCVNGHSVI